MKRILFIALILLYVPVNLSADTLPTGYHYVTRVVRIANCSAFPEYTLVGYITGPVVNGYMLQTLNDERNLNKDYKRNTYKVYALKTSFVNASGGVSAIDFNVITARMEPCAIVDPGYLVLPLDDPLSKETIIYKIAGVRNNKLVLYIAEHTLEYSNGHPPVTEVFDYHL